MRKPLVVANWKLHHTVAEGLAFATKFLHELKAKGTVDIAIAPATTALYSMGIALSESDLQLAAQHLFWEDAGAYTGEVSGPLLKDVGCAYVIIGHSERRRLFGETNQTVQQRVRAGLRAELVPIVCVGETLEERELTHTWNVVETQLKEGLKNIAVEKYPDFVVAYEPVWAIGTGKTPLPTEIQEVHWMIRNWFSKAFDGSTAERVRILYGGSVTPDNSRDIFLQKDVDGALVGGASLDPTAFAEIIRNLPSR